MSSFRIRIRIRIGSLRSVGHAASAFATAFALAGCSGSVTSGAPDREAQIEPTPTPSRTVLPTKPTPSPSPTVIPSPSPKPTVTPTPETPIACLPDRLKFVDEIGVVASADVKANGARISHGLVAAGIALDGAEIGYGLGRGWDRYDVQGTAVTLKFTEVVNASVAYENSIRVGEGTSIFGRAVRGKFVDGAALAASARALRERLNGFPLEGKVTRECSTERNECTVLLKGVHSKFNRFYLDPAIVRAKDNLRIEVPEGSTPVVFLRGGVGVVFKDLYVTGPYETVWVAGDQTKRVSLTWLTLPGTLIAPEADLELEHVLVMGRTIVRSIKTPACPDDETCVTVDSQERVDRTCL